MKTLTPQIAWHNRERVCSLDWQPRAHPPPPVEATPTEEGAGSSLKSGVRLATAGDDHHVVIWDVTFDMEDGKPSIHCLCDLSRHQNSVNVVRWSGDGTLLASGDTDSYIYIWHYPGKESAPDIFGSVGESSAEDENRESWSVLKVLRGHLQDVVGLDFSPCNQYLISCSTDATAIIFDVKKGSKLKILTEHVGWVNGVVWDPLAKYVVSICSDRCLRVYSTKNYKQSVKTSKCKLALGLTGNEADESGEKKVRLFHDDTFQSFFRRLAFSPDGELLVVPSGVLEVEGQAETPHCTYVFSRTDFSKPVLYLPNREYSLAVRFSPLKYQLRPSPKPAQSGQTPTEGKKEPWETTNTLFCLPYRMIYAVATKTTIMFYDTQQPLPFARVSKIHYVGLTDLSWSPDGNVLMVSSTDGFCSFITFKEGELGQIYTEEATKNEKEPKESTTTESKSGETIVQTQQKTQPMET